MAMAVVFTYQNCSQHMDYNELGSSGPLVGKSCLDALRRAYANTYYSTFRSSCIPCHADGGESGKYFASSNFNTAYGVFSSIGRTTVESKATNALHKPPSTGPKHLPMVQDAQDDWKAAEDLYATCAPTTVVGTISKNQPTVYGSGAPPADTVAWPRLTFNMLTDTALTSNRNKIYAEVSVEVRRYRTPGGTVDLGYEFRNPRVKILDDGNASTPLPAIQFIGLRLAMNGNDLTQFTLFGSMNVAYNAATEILMMPGVGYSYIVAPVNSTDQFALKFDAIKDGTGQPIGGGGGGGGGGLPTRVSYAELMSTTSPYNTFQQSCRSCHNAGNARGGLNLENYTQAFNARADILQRMKNAGNPMPQAGLLGPNPVYYVETWINSGAPQN